MGYFPLKDFWEKIYINGKKYKKGDIIYGIG